MKAEYLEDCVLKKGNVLHIRSCRRWIQIVLSSDRTCWNRETCTFQRVCHVDKLISLSCKDINGVKFSQLKPGNAVDSLLCGCGRPYLCVQSHVDKFAFPQNKVLSFPSKHNYPSGLPALWTFACLSMKNVAFASGLLTTFTRQQVKGVGRHIQPFLRNRE